jgi:thiamine-phosphate pyrophosphorylase
VNSVPAGLYLITDRRRARQELVAATAAALDAGFAAVMFREKDLEGGEALRLARPLAALAAARGRAFLVNDRVDVALAIDGAGAHVGRAGIPVTLARRILGEGRLLGYSAHAIDEARSALEEGADYVTVSPVFASASKPGLSPRGIAFLREAAAALPPGRVVALGGMEARHLGEVRAAGAHGAAVMGEMMRAGDPGSVARALVDAWSAVPPDRDREDVSP